MASFSRGVAPRLSPICRPCDEGDHGRCPTAITKHAENGFTSDYACLCYRLDVELHIDAVQERDAQYQERIERESDSIGHLSYHAVARREYQRWAEEL